MVMSPVDLLRFGFDPPGFNLSHTHQHTHEHTQMEESEQDHRQRYPLFEKAIHRAVQCDIDRGDVLFMPSFWW